MKIAPASPIVVGLALCLGSVAAQSPRPALGVSEQTYWIASAALFDGALLLDHAARGAVPAGRTSFTDGLSGVGNVLGLARYDVPVVVAAFAVGHLSRNRRFADATTHIALSYATADLLEAVLKPIVGRPRPYDPESRDAFPSAHVTHVAAIAAAAAEESHSPWATALAASTVSLVSWQRLYSRQHWASDVIAGAIIGVGMSRLTAHWLRGSL
jgi:membrane-associated phospholipid phosphatase